MDRSTYFARHKRLAGIDVFFSSEPMTKVKITIRKGARVYIVEDNEERLKWFNEKMPNATIWQQKDPNLAAEELSWLQPESFDAIFLDFDLGPGNVKNSTINSLPVVDFLKSKFATKQQSNIIIHSANAPGAFMINTLLPGATQIPFGEFDILEVDR